MLTTGALTGIVLLCPQAVPRPAPQEPPAQARPLRNTVLSFDHLIPDDALAAIGVRQLDTHLAEIKKTGWHDLFRPVIQGLPGLAKQLLPENSTLQADDLIQTATRSWTLAWTGMEDNAPTWILLADLGEKAADIRTAVRKKLLEMQESGVRARQEMWKQVGVWAVHRLNGKPISYSIVGKTLIAASSRKQVEGTLARMLEPATAGRSLRDRTGYRSFCRRALEQGSAFACAYVQPTMMIDHMLAGMIDSQRLLARQALGQLQVHAMRQAGLTLTAADGKIQEYLWLTYPAPRSGLVAALLGSSKTIQKRAAKVIDPEAISASIHQLDAHGIYDNFLSLTSSFSQDLPLNIRSWMANTASRTGISFKSDILDMLSGQLVIQSWPAGSSGKTETALVAQIRDAWRLTTGLTKMMRDLPVRQINLLGNNGWALSSLPLDAANTPHLVIAKDRLILASSPRAARRAVRILSLPQTNRMQTALATTEKPPTAVFWSDVRRATRDFLTRLSLQHGDARAAERLEAAIERLQGDMVTEIRQDDAGYWVTSRSPIGNLYSSSALSYGMQSVLRQLGIANTKTSGVAARCVAALRSVVAGQSLFKASTAKDVDRDGIGEFGPLSELVQANCLTKTTIRAIGKDDYRVGDYRLKVLLPKSAMGRELHFAAVAWPADKKRGPVYAINDQGKTLVNNILADSEGIDDFDVRELFVGGAFNTVLVEGWQECRPPRDQKTEPGSTDATQSVKPTSAEERQHYLALLQAERSRTITPDAIAALSARNPSLLSRAAYTMGDLKVKEAVPQLIKLVTGHANVQVRRQAMAALSKIRDQRSVTASVHALSDIDVEVRTYAATNLGRLREKSSVTPLLKILAGTPERGGQDHVAALLALADIGDARCLMMAATTIKNPSLKVEEALTYLYQTLSPKVDPKDEAKALLVALGSRSSMLRRYAIQRLGVLKDPTTVVALESHLTQEDKQLQPLVLISLDAIRGTNETPKSESIGNMVRDSWGSLKSKWNGLPREQRLAWAGGVIGVLFLLVLLVVWRMHVRRKRNAEAWVDMVAPSDGYSRERPSSGLRHAIGGGNPIATAQAVHQRNLAWRAGDDSYEDPDYYQPQPSPRPAPAPQPAPQVAEEYYEDEVVYEEQGYPAEEYGDPAYDAGGEFSEVSGGYDVGYADDYEEYEEGWEPVEEYPAEPAPPPPPPPQPRGRPSSQRPPAGRMRRPGRGGRGRY